MRKKGAMEMSVGTIVTIVLLMSVLVLGIFLIQNIFKSATGAIDLTDQQLTSEIEKLFSEETKLAIYPTSKHLEVDIGETDAIGIGIRNIASTTGVSTNFEYITTAVENDCGVNPSIQKEWMRLGSTESDIPIPINEFGTARIIFKIPEGTPLCLAKFRVSVKRGGANYGSETFTLEVK